MFWECKGGTPGRVLGVHWECSGVRPASTPWPKGKPVYFHILFPISATHLFFRRNGSALVRLFCICLAASPRCPNMQPPLPRS